MRDTLPCKPQDFEKNLKGKEVRLFTIENSNGLSCQITNYGGRITSLLVPDRLGKSDDIVLGYATLQEYLQNEEAYFGAIIGRVANRIRNASFHLNGKQYLLDANKGKHHIHGGKTGFHSKVWTPLHYAKDQLVIECKSTDGEGGYPGNIEVKVTYTLGDNNSLRVKYEAKTDRNTPLSLTNHSYFNLNGAETGSIENHILEIYAKEFSPTDADQIPLGSCQKVEGTPFDFINPKAIGRDIEAPDEQLEVGEGYDHNYVISGIGMRPAAKIVSPESGRFMEVYTNAPSMQFYSGNGLDGTLTGKNGVKYRKRSAFCFETQEFPNSINTPEFPSPVITPDKPYNHICEFRFGIA